VVWYPYATMKKDDLYIAILKHGYDKINEGVTYDSVRQHLEKLGYSFDADDNISRLHKLFYETFSLHTGKKTRGTVDSESKYYIDIDAYFKLVEYTELKEARRASKNATYFAIIAIVISIVAFGFSIYFSIKQLKSPTKIETTQFEMIEEWVKGK